MSNAPDPALKNAVTTISTLHAFETVRALTPHRVLEALQAQGVDTLEELVSNILAEVKGAEHPGELEPWEALCYKHFVYKPPRYTESQLPRDAFEVLEDLRVELVPEESA